MTKYDVDWEVRFFNIEAPNKKAAIECVRRKIGKLYAISCLSHDHLLRIEEIIIQPTPGSKEYAKKSYE